MSYVSTPQPMGVQGKESFSLYPTKVRRWRPMIFLDHEWSSFVPQSHAGRAKSLNYANYLQKKRRDWGERGKTTMAEVLMSLNYPFQGNRNCDWSATCQSVKNCQKKVSFSHIALRQNGGQKRCFETCL